MSECSPLPYEIYFLFYFASFSHLKNLVCLIVLPACVSGDNMCNVSEESCVRLMGLEL